MQEALTHINWLDIVITVVLISGMVVGYTQGMLRQLLVLGVVVISLVLSAQYYQLIYLYVRQLEPNMIETVAQVITFFVVMFVLVVVLTIVLIDVMRRLNQQQKPAGSMSRVIGGALGLIVAGMFVTISLIALTFMTLNTWPGTGEALREWLVSARQRSDFVAVFRLFFPLILQIIRPWVPALPPLFSIDISNI
ncbi:MAG: CvpA family protein [Chloroflexi bacterium]|nr:MAG: CvpA family protein [Chloroflexota bacterium]